MSKKKMTRDELRAKIFTTKKFKSENLELFGVSVEIRQPSLGGILEYQEATDRKDALLQMLIGYCFVPGTTEKLFEEADAAGILAMPFGPDIIALNAAIENLTGLDISGEEGNSDATD